MDFEPIFLAFPHDSYSNPWRGLGRSLSQYPQSVIDDAPEENYWSSAIGATEYYPSEPFIPGPLHTQGHSTQVTRVELYVSKPFFHMKPSGKYILVTIMSIYS